MSDGVNRWIQLYDLSTNQIIMQMPIYAGVEMMEGDEIEAESTGTYKIVRRRWSISSEAVILVLQLEPLA